MRKILLILLISINSLSFSRIFRSDMYQNRGLELMRESNFNQNLDLQKQSGSLQTFELYSSKNKNVKSKGTLLGTSSNFVNNPNVFAGLTIAYEKYKIEDRKGVRDYALNTFLSYKLKKNLIIVGLGYAQGKNVSKRENSLSIELGRFLKDNIYIYLTNNSYNGRYKEHKNIKYSKFHMGISRYDFFNKFRFVNNIELNSDNKKYDAEYRKTVNFTFYSSVAYNIHDDLLVELKYRGTKNSKFYSSLFSLGFTHTF